MACADPSVRVGQITNALGPSKCESDWCSFYSELPARGAGVLCIKGSVKGPWRAHKSEKNNLLLVGIIRTSSEMPRPMGAL